MAETVPLSTRGTKAERTAPVALTIAGSDSSGGAGIQADLRTFLRLGVHGASVVTAVTAQTGRRVTAVHTLPPALVEAQFDAVVAGFSCRAIKIGALGSEAIVEAVAERLGTLRMGTPVVLDPVLAASGGESLLGSRGERALLERLVPRVTLWTPNAVEAVRLAGLEAGLEEEHEARSGGGEIEAASIEEAGRRLAELGPALLVKGGHAAGRVVVDRLFHGGSVRRFERERLPVGDVRGTGCVLSTAIAAHLARGALLERAVERGIASLVVGLEQAIDLSPSVRVPGAMDGLSSRGSRAE